MLQFRKTDPNKQSERERIAKESKQASDEAIGHAQNCLNQEDFKRYREAYERAEKLVIEELILLDETETDPVRYGFRCKDIVSKLRHIGSLLRGVKSDAGKKI